jgi:predicted ester cyclase
MTEPAEENEAIVRRFLEKVRTAVPDWQNQIDEMLAVDDRIVTRMTWSGIHRGAL